MNKNLENKFEECKNTKTYLRIDNTHPHDIYIGYNDFGKKALVIMYDGYIANIESTKMIKTKITKRKDNRFSLSFSLLESSMSKLFYIFCEDIIKSTENIISSNIFNFIMNRWKSWINMFRYPHSLLLNENQIRGLIAELIFLKKYMFKKYGVERSLNSWIGSSKAHKDYEINNTWYEIKAIKENAITVKISSLEQLDSNLEGELITIKLEDSNKEIFNAISLNKYIIDIKNEIKENEFKDIFERKLIEANYFYMEEYDKYIYSNKGIVKYKVNDKFPKLSKEELKDGIVRVSYEIYLEKIKKYIIKGG